MDLCQEKSLEKITLRELLEYTGVAKKTFYNHFNDKLDLIVWIYRRILDDDDDLISKEGFLTYLTRVYQVAKENKTIFCQAAKMTRYDIFRQEVYNIIYHYYQTQVAKNQSIRAPADQVKFGIQYCANATASMFIYWLKAGAHGSAEQQARFVVHYMPKEIKESLCIFDV